MKKSLNKVLLSLATVFAAGSIGNAQNLDYTFVTVGCNRIDPIDIVAAGQGSTYDTISSANVGALNRLFTEVMALSPQPTFLLMTGDIVMGYRADTMYLAKQLQGWKALYNAHPISKSSIKVVVIPGNHETQDKAAGKKSTAALERTFLREMKNFINGNNGPIATGKVAGTDSLMTDQSQLTYSFDYKNDHFLILNTDPTGRDSRLPFRWLRNDLKAKPNARHVFAFGHKPAYSSKFKPLDGLEAFVAQRDSFWTVLENAHAEAMFAAHEHIWDTIQGHKGKTWQVIAGNGGSAVETTVNPVVGKAWNQAPYNYHGFTLVSVYKNGKINCQSMGHDIGAKYFDEVPLNPTTERANFRLETGVVIDHTPMLSTHAVGPFTLTATITDNMSVKADTLTYWLNGVANKIVAVVNGSTYTYTIPAQTGTGSIQYSIKAIDSFGQVTWLPSEPNAKYSFRFGVPVAEGLSSSQSAYVTPVGAGVTTTPILTTGDAIGGYRMAGIPDGLGAYDNGNGTFTLLMNHELSGTPAAPEGIVRAHGGKGAFVSKWVISKSDLSVISGSDLIQTVKLWNGTGYTTYGPADTTKLKSFLRFCSADLPSVSAFYNSASGKGTQERIFMNGEESSAERGRAMGHIATGPNAGTSYELPRLGKAAWENALANPATGDKTLVGVNNDGSITDSKVYFYLGTKTATGTEVEKAGLTNGKLLTVKIAGYAAERTSAAVSNGVPAVGTRFSLLDLGNVENMTGAALNTAANTAGATKFSRVEDGAWDPIHPNDYYFNTTDQLDQVNDKIGTQVGRSKVWRLRFDDINNPELGGVAEAVLDGTEGHTMLDNMAIDNYGHIILLEDVGNAAHNGKVWQYTIATDEFKIIAKHDPARFGDIGVPATAPFNQDEETSGIIDVQDILGAGKFLVVDQAHYLTDAETVEGGQLLQLFNPDTYNSQGTLTAQTPYVLPVASGVTTKAIISSGELAKNSYRMAGIPDGLGAYDNGNGTFTLLMNHELSGTPAAPEGVVRAHGGKGAFVSKWVISKSDLSVISGSDLIQTVKLWNGTGYTTYGPADTTKLKSFLRFCSADLPSVSAFYNSASGKGTQERIFMNGEESSAERGRAMGHIATGPNAGTSYELPRLGKAAWENALANPATGDKTLVGVNNDGSITDSKVYFYLGTKTATGTEVEKAGLTNGKLLTVKIAGYAAERTSAAVSNGVPAVGTRFSLLDLGNVENMTGAALNTAANTAGATKFSRVEDGAWDPIHPNDYYFNTTDQLDQVNDKIGTQVGRSKVWRLRFDDINNPELGGVAEAVLDGTEGHTMLDNMAIDNYGHIILLEDVGNAAHNGKVWQYTIATDEFKIIAKHDPARFGDIGVPATAPFNQDEETSGIIDVQDILGAGKFLVVDQAHYLTDAETVEGGQLLQLFNPDTYNASTLVTGFDDASDVSATSEITLYPTPTNNEATISLKLDRADKAVVSMFDMKGNQVLPSIEKNVSKGVQQITVNTQGLENGIYIMQVSIGAKTTKIKTVILH